MLAVEAVRRHDSPEARASLLAALSRSPALVGVIATSGSEFDVSPDGRHLAVGHIDGLRLLDAGSLTSGRTISGYGFGWWAEYGAHGALLIGAGPRLVELDASGRELRGFEVPGRVADWWWSATYSGDGRRVAAVSSSTEESVIVWDADRPDQPAGRVKTGLIDDFALDQAGKRLLTVTNGPTWIATYDIATGQRLATVPPSPQTRGGDDPRVVAPSPDGAVMAVTDGAEVALVQPRTLREVTRLRGHTRRVTAVEFSQDGRLVAAGAADGTVLVWEPRTGALVERLDGHQAGVADLAFAPDSDTLYSSQQIGSSAQSIVQVWDLDGERRFVAKITGAAGDFGPLPLVAPDGRSVTYFGFPFEPKARFDLIQVPSGQHSTVAGRFAHWGAYSPTGDRFATAAGKLVHVWDPRNGRLVKSREVPGINRADAVTFTGDGSWIVVASASGAVQALDASTLAPVGRQAHAPPLGELLPTPDGHRVIALLQGDAGYAMIDPATGEVGEPVHLFWQRPQAFSGSVSPDGERLALTGEGGWLGVVDLRTGTWLSEPVDAHEGWGWRLDFNPDGSRFASSGADGRVNLWDGATGERLATIRPSGPDSDLGLAYLPDGHTIQVANSRGEVFRWDTTVAAWVDFACRTVGRSLTRDEWREAFGSEVYRRTCPTRAAAR